MTIFSENAETKERNRALQERKALREKKRKEGGNEKEEADDNDQKFEFESKTFTWENINYHVPVQGGSRRLLHDVFGYCKPGTMTALMGSSGAGKTTCLDVLAQRKNIGIIAGQLLMDGRPLASDFARKTAYGKISFLFSNVNLNIVSQPNRWMCMKRQRPFEKPCASLPTSASRSTFQKKRRTPT